MIYSEDFNRAMNDFRDSQRADLALDLIKETIYQILNHFELMEEE